MELNIDFNKIREYSLFIGLPIYGGNTTYKLTKSLIDLTNLFNKYNIRLGYYFLVNESLITRGRNYISDEFMRSGFTHFMFIDADIGFDPEDIFFMFCLSVTQKNDYDVLCGIYPRKTIAWEKVLKAAKSGLCDTNPNDLAKYSADYVFNPIAGSEIKIFEPSEVLESGTGFMLIPREVFDKFNEKYPNLRFRPDHNRSINFNGSREISLFFDTEVDPETKRYLSEDYFFCQKIRKIGMKVHILPWIKLSHVGSYDYEGDIVAIAQLNMSATSDDSVVPK